MAFMGILLVGILLWVVIIAIICVVLAVFVPCLIISIVNLVKGIKNHWPKRNIIPLAITGSIVILFISLFIVLYIRSVYASVPVDDTSAASSAVNILRIILKLQKYIFFN